MITFETGVRINRPIEEVFAYVSDPLNFPRWNSAVHAVRKISGDDNIGVGSTYVMERTLRTGKGENALQIVAREQPSEFAIRTTSGPTPLVYNYRFSPDDGETLVQLDAVLELKGAHALLGPIAGRLVKNGVDDNLATLKKILEARALWGVTA